MPDRKPSAVASYLRSGKRPGAVAWTGGRGRQGPLGAWLLREKAAIVEGRGAVPALTWREVSALAAEEGVTRPGGGAYTEREMSKAWSNLVARKLVPALGRVPAAAVQPTAPVPQQVPVGSVPAPRGQAGTAGAGVVQTPAPMPPSPAAAPAPERRTGEAASKDPLVTALDLPRIKGLRGRQS